MSPFAFYIGAWSCQDGPIGRPTHAGTWTFVMRDDLMLETVVVPKQKDMASASFTNATFAFDAKNNRYVETEMDNTSAWYVSTAEPGWKNTIYWKDIASWTRFSRWEMTRLDSNTFMVQAYPATTATRPNYKAICKR